LLKLIVALIYLAIDRLREIMLWTFLRIGWGNTALIFALCLLPLVTLADIALDRYGQQQHQSILGTTIVDTAAIASASDSLDYETAVHLPSQE
jgi:hypothetical protein